MSQFFQGSAHWYSYDAATGIVQSCHDADLREARKRGLFTSPSSVLKSQASESLTNYKLDELYKAVAANPRRDGETEQQHRARVREAAEAHMKEAQEFGTALHDALQAYPQLHIDARFQPWVDCWAPVYDELIEETIGTEVRLADPDIGVAGTTDLIVKLRDGRIALGDHKSSGWKDGKPSFYPDHCRQLAFYAKAYQKKMGLEETPAIFNVGHNRDEPCRPVVKMWSAEEQEQAYVEFLLATYMWCASKRNKSHDGYWPTGKRWEIEVFVGTQAVYP